MRTLQGSSGHHEQSQWGQNKHLEDLRQGWLGFGLKATSAPCRGIYMCVLFIDKQTNYER